MYIDTHLHLSKKDYESIDDVIERANQSGVQRLIVSACDKESMEECLNDFQEYANLAFTFGYHPSIANDIKKEDLINLEQMLQGYSNIVGVGEIGLDYHYGKENKEKQIQLFQEQLQLAQKLNLPVVIHSRDATEDTIAILKQYSLRGVIHCFTGSLETANIYLSMGYLFGIGGVVTFSNSNLKEVVKKIPLESIVLETDSPYLAPVPIRGSINESKNIPYIAEKIADIKGVPLTLVEEITTANARRIFDLDVDA